MKWFGSFFFRRIWKRSKPTSFTATTSDSSLELEKPALPPPAPQNVYQHLSKEELQHLLEQVLPKAKNPNDPLNLKWDEDNTDYKIGEYTDLAAMDILRRCLDPGIAIPARLTTTQAAVKILDMVPLRQTSAGLGEMPDSSVTSSLATIFVEASQQIHYAHPSHDILVDLSTKIWMEMADHWEHFDSSFSEGDYYWNFYGEGAPQERINFINATAFLARSYGLNNLVDSDWPGWVMRDICEGKFRVRNYEDWTAQVAGAALWIRYAGQALCRGTDTGKWRQWHRLFADVEANDDDKISKECKMLVNEALAFMDATGPRSGTQDSS